MEENLQKDNPREDNSYFLKRKWWRPLYYVYFVAAFAGVVLIYSARRHGVKPAASSQAVSTQQAQTASTSSQIAANNQSAQAISSPVVEKQAPAPQPAEKNAASSMSSEKNASAVAGEFAYMMSPSSKLVSKGKSLFMQNCVACHGANGEGDGPAAAALKPKPRDFHSAKGWINGRLASGMFKTLTHGIPGSPMPPFNSISVKDRLAIISYIRSYKGFPKETKADIRTLTKMVHESGGSGQNDD